MLLCWESSHDISMNVFGNTYTLMRLIIKAKQLIIKHLKFYKINKEPLLFSIRQRAHLIFIFAQCIIYTYTPLLQPNNTVLCRDRLLAASLISTLFGEKKKLKSVKCCKYNHFFLIHLSSVNFRILKNIAKTLQN